MMDLTKQNLENRNATIKGQLGVLAYQRREHQLAIEGIDKQVAAMEAQGVLIEATLSDLNTDRTVEEAKQEQAKADAKTKRSKAGKAGAAKRTSKG